MKSDPITVESLFKDRRQYRVPFFQRHYVWSEEAQWRPLWEDVADKAEQRRSGDQPAPHFLGAIVLDPQARQGLKGVEVLNIIDGQQRLTTLQFLLAGLLLIAREKKSALVEKLITPCTSNDNPDTMQDPLVEKHKVWPTFIDRPPYIRGMASITRDELREAFPAHFTDKGNLRKIGIAHPPVLEAVWFFADEIARWVAGEDVSGSLEAVTSAVLHDLKFVSILLEQQDDAQIIFETLNGRGAELHATDLIRNYIFMRADREAQGQGQPDAETLYETLWREFEGTFWTEPQRRGRLNRPRLEWFMQTALQAELASEIDVGRLYAAYVQFAQPKGSSKSAQQQLEILRNYALIYQDLIQPAGKDSEIARFGRAIAVWDASPIHPLTLRIARSTLSLPDQRAMYDAIVSYVVRRAICGLTNKSYNKVFLQLLRSLSGEKLTPANLLTELGALRGDASRWPRDDELLRALLNGRIYKEIGETARLRAILVAFENALRSRRSEETNYTEPGTIDIDHILPDDWLEHWPVEGQRVTPKEVEAAELADLLDTAEGRDVITARRQKLKHTIGNLTLLHYGVNRGLRNKGFDVKQKALFKESNLHLNRELMVCTHWDEDAIENRSKALFEVARKIWSAPDA